MSKKRRLSWLGLACVLPIVVGVLALLEWHRRQQAASAGEQTLDASGIALSANDLQQKYSDPQEFARLCAAAQQHYDASVDRSLQMQHLRKSRMIEFDRRNQPIAIVEMQERIHFEDQKECSTKLDSQQVLGRPSAFPPGGSQGGLNVKAPFSSEAARKGLYRYQWEGVEEVAGQLALRLHFEPVQPIEGSFKGSVWVDPVTAEPIRMHGTAVKLLAPLDRLEMLIDYGPAESGYNQMRRATVDVAGGFAFIIKHYRIETELSDYRAREPRASVPKMTRLSNAPNPRPKGYPVMSIGIGVVLAFASVALLALASTLASCWRWKQRRLAALRAGSQLVQTARGPLEYAVSGEGPPLLVIHGGMGGYDQALGLGALVNRYAGAAGFTVIAPSRPGYLRTPLEVGRAAEEQADALAVLLDHLGIAQVGVLAGSYGGPVALQFALRHPQRLGALVLLAAITGRCKVGQQWPVSERFLLSPPLALLTDFCHWLMYLRARSRPTTLVRFFMRRMTVPSVTDAEIDRRIALLTQDPDQIYTVQQQFCSMTPMSLQMIGCLNDEKQIATLSDYPLENIQTPALLVYGREDCVGLGIAGAEWAAGKMPRAQLLVVEQCGHFLLAGPYLPAVFSTVAEFLCRHGVEETLIATSSPDPVREKLVGRP